MNPIIFVKTHKLAAIFSIIAAGLIAIAVANRIAVKNEEQPSEKPAAIKLIKAGDLRRQNPVDIGSGTAESLSQADLKSQISAQIFSVNVKLGDTVAAGQTIAQLQNSDIKAQLEQAESRLSELKKGARAEDINISRTSVNESKAALINAIKDAYAKSDDAVHNHIDKFFANPRQSNAEFLIVINVGTSQSTLRPADTELAQKVTAQKYDLEAMFGNWERSAAGISRDSSDEQMEAAAKMAQKNLETQIDFFNQMSPLVNDFSSDNATYKQIIDGYKTEFSAARATVTGSMSGLQGSLTTWLTAKQALEYKLAGASTDQIKQAQAAVDALQATLAKTAIVSPINGKISYINGNIGELASPGMLIASVVNPNALQIKAYVSENDLSSIAIGDTVLIGNGAKGVIQTIAPAIDSQTKKAEINALVTENPPQNGKPAVIVGQAASIKVIPLISKKNQDIYLAPIEAVQFTDHGNYVLSPNEENVLKQIPVTVGETIGENVQIVAGISDQTIIAASTRGLREGEKINPEK